MFAFMTCNKSYISASNRFVVRVFSHPVDFPKSRATAESVSRFFINELRADHESLPPTSSNVKLVFVRRSYVNASLCSDTNEATLIIPPTFHPDCLLSTKPLPNQ